MFTGQLIAIAVASNKKEPMQSVSEIEAISGGVLRVGDEIRAADIPA